MKNPLLFCCFIIFIYPNNLYAKEKDVGPLDIEDVKKLVVYQPIKELPDAMKVKFNPDCDFIQCQGKKAGMEVYHRFVKKKRSMSKYPGKMMMAMAWFEILYHSNLEKTDMHIKRYLLNEGKNYKAKEIDEMAILSLMSMNKGREAMRKSLGMSMEVSIEEAINNFWVMGEFLDQGKPKKVKVDEVLLERKDIIKKYKSKISKLLQKVEESKKK